MTTIMDHFMDLEEYLSNMFISTDFYGNFKCRAGECKHTCCAGWEIDIDDISLERFRSYDGELGKKMKEVIAFDDGEYHFINDENDRCPFLRGDGLCQLIIEKGEDDLSDICALHPRFYFDIDDFWFSGHGMACEVVSDQLVSSLKGRDLCFIIEDEENYIEDNKKDLKGLLKLMSFDSSNIKMHLSDYIKEKAFFDTKICHSIISKTEEIDNEWLKEIAGIDKISNEELMQFYSKDKEFIDACDRIYQYIFYRALEKVHDHSLETIEKYAAVNCQYVIMYLMANKDMTLSDAVRRWSQQIEYAVENSEYVMTEVERIKNAENI